MAGIEWEGRYANSEDYVVVQSRVMSVGEEK